MAKIILLTFLILQFALPVNAIDGTQLQQVDRNLNPESYEMIGSSSTWNPTAEKGVHPLLHQKRC